MAQRAETRIASVAVTAIAAATGARVLAVIDNDDHWRPVVDRLLAAGAGTTATTVVLLNIQPKPDEMRTRGLFQETIRARLLERGREMLAPAERALGDAGVACTTRVELAEDDVEAIVRLAREEGCGSIIVATPPTGALRRTWAKATGWCAGTTASRLAELADLPVLVVHPGDR